MSPGWPILLAGLLMLVFGEYLRRLIERHDSYSMVHVVAYVIGGFLILFASLGLAAIDGEYLPLTVFGGLGVIGGLVYADGLARDRW